MKTRILAGVLGLCCVGGVAHGGEGDETVVFGLESTWRYWDQGTRPGAVEREGFDDTAWPEGPGPLGYGDVGMNTVVEYGPDHDNKHITTYFRKTFEVPEGLASRDLVLRYQRDDGLLVFLNGVEILRDNLPAGRVTPTTRAVFSLGGEESEVVEAEIDTALLRDGENLIVAEVHQASPGSADMRFDLALAVREAPRNYEGAGTAEDPFRIETREQFLRIGERPGDWDNHFVLTGHFTLHGVEGYRPIGVGHREQSFSGVFDGLGNTLQGLTYEGEPGKPAGLFGLVTGTIRNLRVFGCRVEVPEGDFVGALVGQCEGRLENCLGINLVVSGKDQVGALAGLTRFAVRCGARSVNVTGTGTAIGGLAGTANVVRECWSSGTVEGGWYTGGLVGAAFEEVRESFSLADVEGTGPTGGLVGLSSDQRQIVRDCYARGDVRGSDLHGTGGLVGLSTESSIVRSYATGSVTAPAAAGGLIGTEESPWGENVASFWDVQASGREEAIGANRGEGDTSGLVGLTTAAMASARPFLEAGWDFSGERENGERDVWKMVADGPPRLWWEEEPGVVDGGRLDLVAWGSEWKYWDRGEAPEGWWQPFYDDIGWERGRAELGYGDGDEVTVVGFGEDPASKHVTTYFRREFLFETGKVPEQVVLEVKRDDGVRVFLNGEEILRDNLPDGEIGSETLATGVAAEDGARLVEVPLPGRVLKGGHNIFAVEVHQVNPSSSDLSFDLRLSALVDPPGYAGTGTEEDPYRLVTAAHLVRYSQTPGDWSGHAVLVEDIDLEGMDYDQLRPIGEDDENRFTGVFDGQGHKIFNYRNPEDNDGDDMRVPAGLWELNRGVIRNLRVEGFVIGESWERNVGVIARRCEGLIENCHAVDGRVRGDIRVGGLVGDGKRLVGCTTHRVNVEGSGAIVGGLAGLLASMERCRAGEGEVVGDSEVGGLAGFLYVFGEFCAGHADVEARDGFAGGLVGNANDREVLLRSCYALGRVTARGDNARAGGLIGYLSESSVRDCYAAGEVSAPVAGGLIGEVSATWGENLATFWDVEQSRQERAAGRVDREEDVAGFVGLTTAQAMTAQPFLAAGWDFALEDENGDEDIWKYIEGSYPRLWWEEGEAQDPTVDPGGGGGGDEVELVAAGSTWRYEDEGSRIEGWTGLEFDDGSWPFGPAQLGYGDGDEVTVVGFGDDPSDRFVTTFFRHVFEVDGGAVPEGLVLGLLRDDGAVVYLNGVEVVRDNLPPGEIGDQTLATAAVGGAQERTEFVEFELREAELRPGRNVLAVEVHQVHPSSSDLSFDLWLRGRVDNGGGGGNDDDTDGDGLPDAWELDVFGDLSHGPEGDADGDGLSNGREFELGTYADGADSDGDGFDDGLEVAFGSDPLDGEDTPRRLGEKLLAGDGGAGDRTGDDVAISGDTAVLGAPGERAAYVFRREWRRARDGGPRWRQVARLDDGTDELVAANTGFGAAVAVYGRRVAVGAPGLETVFLYERGEDGEYGHAGRVTIWDDPATAAIRFVPGSMAYGMAVAMHGGVLVVGAPNFLGTGVAYVYERQRGGDDGEREWRYGGRLMPALDPVVFRPNGLYGQAVAVHGRRIAVLTPIGARVHVFERGEERWEDAGELWAGGEVPFPAGVRGDVAVYRGRVAAVGIGDPGRVHLWRTGRDGEWVREESLETPVEQLDSVGMWGPTVVAGASGDRSFGVQSGAAYVFKRGRWREGGWAWELDQTLFPRDPMAEKDFGHSVAVSRSHTLVGAPRDGELGASAGAGYVFGQQRFRRFGDWLWRHWRERHDGGGGGEGGRGPEALAFALGDDAFGWKDPEAAPSLVAGAGEADGVPCLTFTFTLPDPVPGDVEYEVQVASELDGVWETVAVRGADGEWDGDATVVEHMAEDGRVCVVVHDVVPLGEDRERFVRLVVRVL